MSCWHPGIPLRLHQAAPAPDLLLRTVPALRLSLPRLPSLPVSFRGRRRHRGCSLQALREDRSYFQGTSACCLHTPALPESPRSAPLSAAVLRTPAPALHLPRPAVFSHMLRTANRLLFLLHRPHTGSSHRRLPVLLPASLPALSSQPFHRLRSLRLTALQVLPDPRTALHSFCSQNDARI